MNVVNLEEFKLKRLAIFAAPAEDPVETEDDNAHLQKAMLGLHKATLKQHAQVKKFRRVTLDLADKISKLEQSCVRFDRNIRRIRLDPLNRVARTLSGTMDSYLSKA